MTHRKPTATLLALVAAFAATPGRACGPAPPLNQTVAVADETAIIVWDAATQTQHFIRRATFTTGAKDFGFLVPTPSRPTLAEADDAAFARLEKVTAPPPVPYTPPANSGFGCGCGGGGPRAAATVRVIEEKRVAGYDATVLQADDAAALGEWLKARGYEDSPQIRDWLKPYVADKWTVTAFRVVKVDPAAPTAAPGAVRMSFPTDKPFFPYREPAARPVPNGQKMTGLIGPPSRLLRVYFIATARTDGVVSVGPPTAPAIREEKLRVRWAGPLPADAGPDVAQLLGLPAGLPDAAYLTELEMQHVDRVGCGDVWFAPSADQNMKNRAFDFEPKAARPAPVADFMTCAVLAACLTLVGVNRLRRRA